MDKFNNFYKKILNENEDQLTTKKETKKEYTIVSIDKKRGETAISYRSAKSFEEAHDKHKGFYPSSTVVAVIRGQIFDFELFDVEN